MVTSSLLLVLVSFYSNVFPELAKHSQAKPLGLAWSSVMGMTDPN